MPRSTGSDFREKLPKWENTSSVQGACAAIGILALFIALLDGWEDEAELFRRAGRKAVSTVRGVIGDSPPDTPPGKNQQGKEEQEQAQDTQATETRVAAVEPEHGMAENTDENLSSPARWFKFTLIRDAPLWTYSGERADIACG